MKLSWLLLAGSLFVTPLCRAESSYNISLFFGYIDQHPSNVVIDGQEEEGLITYLTSPCQGQNLFCDFEPTTQLNMFKKKIGPKEVVLHLYNSSLSNYDPDNRINPEQRQKSQETETQFLGALLHEQAVFYLGHSRYGYGPDFFPATLNAQGLVDHSLYAREHQNVEKIAQTLAISASLEYLSLSSCDAEDHFALSMEKVNPRVRLLLAPENVVSPLTARKELLRNMEIVLHRVAQENN